MRSALGAACVAFAAFAAVCAATRPAGSTEAAVLTAPATTVVVTNAAPRPAEARSWREIESDASRLLGRRVRFVAQMRGPVERWNAYRSRFGPRTHAAFQGWADEQFLWLRDEYDAPRVRVFARQGTPEAARLAHAAKYTRFEIEGTVRELFLAEPWIEVESVELLLEHVTDGDLIHASRGIEFIEREVWTFALSELDQAAGGNLPLHAARELERLRAACREAVGTSAKRAPRPWPAPPGVRVLGGGRSGARDDGE
jgi:hypothetical protein